MKPWPLMLSETTLPTLLLLSKAFRHWRRDMGDAENTARLTHMATPSRGQGTRRKSPFLMAQTLAKGISRHRASTLYGALPESGGGGPTGGPSQCRAILAGRNSRGQTRKPPVTGAGESGT